MTADQFAAAVAHLAASKFVEGGFESPDSEIVGMAILQDAGVRFVVSITRYEGPARFFPANLASQEAPKCPPGTVAPASPSAGSVAPDLTPLQRRIIEALGAVSDRTSGRKAAWIAMRIGAKCSGSFRSMLADMVRFGVLKRATGGGYALVAGGALGVGG